MLAELRAYLAFLALRAGESAASCSPSAGTAEALVAQIAAATQALGMTNVGNAAEHTAAMRF